MKCGHNVFLTGAAGTGKTYVIRGYISYLRDHGIFPTIVAPTGIAASHIGGMTIHSCFGLGIFDGEPDTHYLNRCLTKQGVKKRLQDMEVLIVDEVSMLSPPLGRVIDELLRMAKDTEEPFGGIQVILSGDFFQLPPINRGSSERCYIWQDELWHELSLKMCYLQKSYRQNDDALLNLLNEIRRNEVSETSLEHLRSRYLQTPQTGFHMTKLYTHNADIDRINAEELEKLGGEERMFNTEGVGNRAKIEKLISTSLMQDPLFLKKGALVMFVKNSPEGRFVNGTLGKVIEFDKDNGYPIIETKDTTILAAPMEWTDVDEHGDTVASVSQVPLRLAWAITIHKSQGMTLDAAEIDLSRTFEVGQGYVALSRLRSLAGLKLIGMNQNALMTAPELLEEDARMQYQSREDQEAYEMLAQPEVFFTQQEHLIAHKGRLEKIEFKEEKNVKFLAPKAKKESTYALTRELLLKKLSLEEIARERELKVNTIISHVVKIHTDDRSIDLAHIRPDDTLMLNVELAIESIREKNNPESFEETDIVRKSAIYNHLQGALSYDEISLVLVCMKMAS